MKNLVVVALVAISSHASADMVLGESPPHWMELRNQKEVPAPANAIKRPVSCTESMSARAMTCVITCENGKDLGECKVTIFGPPTLGTTHESMAAPVVNPSTSSVPNSQGSFRVRSAREMYQQR